VIRHPFDDNSILSSSTRRTSVSSKSSNSMNRITTNGNEMELQQWTSALLAAEEEAVINESYQIAKTYKYLGDKLGRFTKILSDLEIGKRHAVETKDYDEAEKIKDDIKEIKQAAELLLKQAHIQITPDGNVISIVQEELNIPTSYHQLLEDTTIIGTNSVSAAANIIPNNNNYSSHYIQEEEEEEEEEQEEKEEQEEQEDIDDIIPIEQEYVDPDSIPEPIMDEERIPYTLAIQIFGEHIVACVLSIKAKCRNRGLGLIQERIESVLVLINSNELDELFNQLLVVIDDDDEEDEEEEEEEEQETITKCLSHFINATLMLIQEAVMDSREPVVLLAISAWHKLINIPMQSTTACNEWIEKTFSGLLKRTGDTNLNIKNACIELIILLVKSFKFLSTCFICKPERLIHNYKEAKSRIELVETIVVQLGIYNLSDLMAFVVAYLNHTNDQVRQAAVKLLVTISDRVGFNIVSTYIDETLRLSLAEVSEDNNMCGMCTY
jgi:centrosomal protein CEP104